MENGEYYQRGKMEGGRWNVESEKWKLDVRPGLPYLSLQLSHWGYSLSPLKGSGCPPWIQIDSYLAV